MKAIPVSAGVLAKNVLKAARPPAEAPMPTTRLGGVACGLEGMGTPMPLTRLSTRDYQPVLITHFSRITPISQDFGRAEDQYKPDRGTPTIAP
jgi:hypothetical protein